MVVPGRVSFILGGPRPGMLRGEGAILVMGETLLLPLLFSTLGLFRVRFSREFRSIAADVRFSKRDPAEPAIALAKKGGRKLAAALPSAPPGLGGGRNNGGLAEGPASMMLGLGNFCCCVKAAESSPLIALGERI